MDCAAQGWSLMVVMVSVAWHIVGSRKNGACMVLERVYPLT